jgi:hypothetical protein
MGGSKSGTYNGIIIYDGFFLFAGLPLPKLKPSPTPGRAADVGIFQVL